MFTGIIEALGAVRRVAREGSNVHFTLESAISDQLKVDQSLAHDGVCLTVIAVEGHTHTVTAVEETIRRSNLGDWKEGKKVNLERAMVANARLDGHMVQGHIDTTGICTAVEEAAGSWYYRFKYPLETGHLLVDKGSICINGVSLTVVDPHKDRFSVAIIPFTHGHTNFHQIEAGSHVNLEFDIIGKYIARYYEAYQK
ncbi:MAG: riboflavin synthase [Saprospiraceae bacterium]|nr:riboflavin synthase [Saprospiraceae bacterium]MCB0625751.1 riboflavin synthase [Saprospiraceae bacterium]MCB0675845.1 riboflavin synthase [Saprospiraceae bacterium]MCB0679555.1 riboflavin synthase [Saprospiraceae bacterium]